MLSFEVNKYVYRSASLSSVKCAAFHVRGTNCGEKASPARGEV